MRVEWNKVIRYLAYTLELLVLFMLQETPGLLPPLFGARPVLLFPAVITIAIPFTSLLYHTGRQSFASRSQILQNCVHVMSCSKTQSFIDLLTMQDFLRVIF